MKQPPKIAPTRRRRMIDVYFILYLAALLLLLPNKREKATEADPSLLRKILASRFFIQPEKTTLSCQLISSASGTPQIISLDSLNILYSSGEVNNIHYEFQITDASQQQMIAVSAQKGSVGKFSVQEDSRLGTARFLWSPDISYRRNKIFTVQVIATAKPMIPASITDPALKEKLERLLREDSSLDTARTSFTINVFFLDSGPVANNDSTTTDSTKTPGGATLPPTNGNPALAQNRINNPPLPTFRPVEPGDFELTAETKVLDVLPFQQWENTIWAYGSDYNFRRDSRNSPKVTPFHDPTADRRGTALLADMQDNKVRIRGTAPGNGVMTVRVSTTRSSDNKEKTAQFTVRATPIQKPEIPPKMNPGIQYTLDPRFPMLTNQDTKAILSESGKERFSTSRQGERFVFSPREADIGKTFVLERYINGNRIGESYQITVEDFPAPEILEISPQNKIILVRTRSFGQVGGLDNRVTLDIAKLINATVHERFGDFQMIEARQEISQLFELRRIDPDKPISGLIRIIDKKNRTSHIKQVQ